MPFDPTFLLAHLPPHQAPADLSVRILSTIRRQSFYRLCIQFSFVVTGFLLSAGYAIWNWSTLRGEMGASSFFSFFKLLFSDPDIVVAHGMDFLSGLLESFPVSTVLIFTISLFFCLSLASFMKRAIRLPSHRPSLV